jgi:flagellin
MSVINTNVNSLVSQAALARNERSLSSAMQQLSTGTRINSAKDDAAGLAITSRMSAQIRGLNQAVRNANDGISLLQTAEGATIEMTNMLQRMRELSVQSANDTNTTSDREYLDLEYQQLMKEVARTAATAEWNGMKLLNNTQLGVDDGTGDARTVAFQVGANADQTIEISMKNFSFDTGTSAVASKKQINLAVVDFAAGAGGQIFTLTIGASATVLARDFRVSLPAADALDADIGETTAAQTVKLRDAMRTEINNTVGFENVKIESDGAVITITDSEGRAIGNVSMFEADGTTDADGANSVPTGSSVAIDAGQLATGADLPPNDSVFSADARLNNTNIKSLAASNTATTRLDVAIDSLNKERATMGAMMNRLAYAADGLAKTSTNTTASRSRIMDTDYAAATAELARTQIIQQAATAMLAQANQSSQSVLSLLKG